MFVALNGRASTVTTSSRRRLSGAPRRPGRAAAALACRRSSSHDPLAALSAFAREWRRQFRIPVVGVTGSNGKTTTKELIGSMLSGSGPTLVTRGNLNNHLGVPLTLLAR